MKHLNRCCVIIVFLFCCSAYAGPAYIALRSQAVAAARELVGWQSLINRPCADGFYGAVSITPEYTHSFKGESLANCLFFPDLICNGQTSGTIAISGSLVPVADTPFAAAPFLATNTNRDIHEWLADYFGLPRDYASILCFKPTVWNFTTDVNLYLGLDCWARGLYFRVHAPICYTQCALNAQEFHKRAGIVGYDAGYFGPQEYQPEQLLHSALSFLTGCESPALTPVQFDRLAKAKFTTQCQELNKVGIADIEMAFGWNFIRGCDYHLGLEVRASAPTGNKPCANYVLSPVVGSGGFWKLGGGLTAHGIMWQCEDASQSFGFYLDVNVQHLFKTCQERVFDLCCKPNSRYMLAQKLDENTNELGFLHGDTFTLSPWQFANEFAPIANLTAQNVDVSVDVEGNLVADFVYVNNNLQWEVGYELWARGCESICPCAQNFIDRHGIWALKGDAYVDGYADGSWYPLAATESKATMHSGTNFAADTPLTRTNADAAWYNPHIDNPELAVIHASTVPVDLLGGPGLEQTRTSIEPIIITSNAIDYQGAATQAASHKIFTHLSYTWHNTCRATPFIGIGAFAEFATSSCDNHCAQTTCFPGCTMGATVGCSTVPTTNQCAGNSCCQECGVSQWGLWVKGGVGF